MRALISQWVSSGKKLLPEGGQVLRTVGNVCWILFLAFSPALVRGQILFAAQQSSPQPVNTAHESLNPAASASDTNSQGNPQTQPASARKQEQKAQASEGQQTKRILGVAPNFAAVSANTQLPPLTAKQKFVLATHDSVDYSSFIWTGILAAQEMGTKANPELGHGAAGYGRYYWRTFTDGLSGAFFTEAIVPAITREDPRYYTLGHGGFFHRMGYAISRVVLTKTDSGSTRFNVSEVVGNALVAGLSNAYYPPQDRGLRQTTRNWGAQIESATLNNIFKEFWPDIRTKILHMK
jgi:hypothetical protein